MRAFFDLWSTVYDYPGVQALVYRPVQNAVMHALSADRPARILDIGCGTGILTARAAHELGDAEVVGSDFSHEMLLRARRRNREVGWVRADALHLPFRDESFDAVMSTESFHWFPDQVQALAELFRVTRPGATLAVAMVNPPTRTASEVVDRYAQLGGQPAHWPTQREMADLVGQAGFVVQAQRYIFRLPAGPLFPPVLTVARKPSAA